MSSGNVFACVAKHVIPVISTVLWGLFSMNTLNTSQESVTMASLFTTKYNSEQADTIPPQTTDTGDKLTVKVKVADIYRYK